MILKDLDDTLKKYVPLYKSSKDPSLYFSSKKPEGLVITPEDFKALQEIEFSLKARPSSILKPYLKTDLLVKPFIFTFWLLKSERELIMLEPTYSTMNFLSYGFLKQMKFTLSSMYIFSILNMSLKHKKINAFTITQGHRFFIKNLPIFGVANLGIWYSTMQNREQKYREAALKVFYLQKTVQVEEIDRNEKAHKNETIEEPNKNELLKLKNRSFGDKKELETIGEIISGRNIKVFNEFI